MYERLYEMAAVCAVVLVALAYLAVRSWRGRQASQMRVLGELPAAFELAAELEFDGFYVATTVAGQPLERIIAGGLAHRGRCVVKAAAAGLVIERAGESAVFVPASQIVAIHSASATIDRVVENDGLTVIRWSNNGTEFDTNLRLSATEAKRALVNLFNNLSSKETH